MNRKTFQKPILTLEDNQVFVFGSNLQGFHGAGSAGFASFGELYMTNPWRKYKYDEKPDGWKGRWNVKGVGDGFQEGMFGKSYALPTVTKPGHKRSRSKEEIKISIKKLYDYARWHPEWDFLIAYCGKSLRPLNGYSNQELSFLFQTADIQNGIPNNIIFEEEFSSLVFSERS